MAGVCRLARGSPASRALLLSGAAPARPRPFRSVTDAGELEEILGAHVAKQPAGAGAAGAPADGGPHPALRREALGLYRDILRASRLFTWTNETGHVWRDVIRTSARKEFEQSRRETDAAVVQRLIVGGRDALQKVIDDTIEKARREVEKGHHGAPR